MNTTIIKDGDFMSDLYIPGLEKDDPVEFIEALADNFTALKDGKLNYSPASPATDWEPSEVADALDILASSRIVEQGENENGQYWRWENGFQVCVYRSYNSDTPKKIEKAVGEVYISELFEHHYPAVFSEVPIMIGSANFYQGRGWFGNFASLSRSSISYRLFSYGTIGASQAETGSVQIISIGRWD